MIARVAQERRKSYVLRCDDGTELEATLSGKVRYDTAHREDLPAVGDLVRVRGTIIDEVMPRRTAFLRKAAGEAIEAQVIAANIDTVFVVTGLDGDFNIRRLERYYVTAKASGAHCTILLNKADLCADLDSPMKQVRAIAPDADVVTISALQGDGLNALEPYLSPGKIVAFVGSSGAGKSTLINRLMGHDRQTVGGLRESDGLGKHTTTHRELMVTSTGAFLIDTPGLRELQPWAAQADVESAFKDIEEIASQCRYRGCAHTVEEDCAIKAAIEAGTLDADRFASYGSMKKEAADLEARRGIRTQIDQKAKVKKIHRSMRDEED